MIKKGFLKPAISIRLIGTQRFWLGIVFGLISAVLFNTLFSYTRESFRFVISIDDLFLLPEKEFHIYDLFYACFATSMGLGICLTTWLSSYRIPGIKKSYLRNYALGNIWFVILICLSTFVRFAAAISFSLFKWNSGDKYLNFIQNFWVILALIPLFIISYQWNILRVILKTRKWIIASYLACGFVAFYLYKTTSPDREVVNQAHYERHKVYFDYISFQITEARSMGVSLTKSTESLLKRKYSPEKTELAIQVKEAFNTDKLVSVDTLIIQKILIHSLHMHGSLDSSTNQYKTHWSFATPDQVYDQIINHRDVNSYEVVTLFEILHEQITLFDVNDLRSKRLSDFTEYDYEREQYNWHLKYIASDIRERLEYVISQLKNESKFECYYYLIPELPIVADKDRFLLHDLEL